LQNTADGTAVYVETQTPTTNANGLLSIYIGAGTPVGSEVFSDINWSTGSYFIKIEIDTSGDNGSYDITGTTKLVSVPYALYAKTAGSSTDGWKLTGNANTDGTNFIGTTDDIPFNIRVNNIPAGRIDSNGNTSLGYDTFTIDGVAIGNESDGVFSVAIGNASSGVFGSVAIGNASIGVEESVTIGNGSYSEFEGITIGNYSYNEGLNSIAIGNGITLDEDNTIQLGNNEVTAVQLGTGANVTLETGLVKITGGIPGVGKVLTSDADGLASWQVAAANVREIADEFPATANQTTFTLTQTPSTNSKVKMYVNGIRISNTAYTYTSTGTSLTYESANNGGYVLTAGDRIQFDYFY
jgi:hypothetical protein